MGRVMFGGGKIDMAAPVAGILLSSIAEGSIVKLNENGSPVEFYVAKHNYESSLNGSGRTLLVRKNVFSNRVWNTGENTCKNFANSSVCAFLNGDYKALFSSKVQAAIGTTKFFYTNYSSSSAPSNQTSTNIATKSIFMPSVTEFGIPSVYHTGYYEGTALPIASQIFTAKLNGTNVHKWTRTPHFGSGAAGYVMAVLGTYNNSTYGDSGKYLDGNEKGIIPCFTLPSTTLFYEDTMLFKGVA